MREMRPGDPPLRRLGSIALSLCLSTSKHRYSWWELFISMSASRWHSPPPPIPSYPPTTSRYNGEREVVFTVDTASHSHHTARAGAVDRAAPVPMFQTDGFNRLAFSRVLDTPDLSRIKPHPISQPATATATASSSRRRNPPTCARPPCRQTRRAYSPRQTRQTRPLERCPQ